jgi:hypothetical protein
LATVVGNFMEEIWKQGLGGEEVGKERQQGIGEGFGRGR